MYLHAVILQIVMLLIIVAIGVGLRHKNIFSDPVIKGSNTLLLKIAWPAMILMSAQKELPSEQIPEVMKVLLISALIMTLTCLLVYFLFKGRITEDKLAVFAGISTMPNVGYVGIPIINAMYGSLGVIYLSGSIIALNIVMWTVFNLLIQQGGQINPLQTLINPGIIASLAAIAFILTGLRLPEPLLSLCNQLGNMTIPLSMLLVGARLKETIRVKQLKDRLLWLSIAIRLLIIPIAVTLVLKGLGFSGISYGVLTVAFALPAAAATQFMAEQYNRNTALAAQSASASLLLCLITLPLVLLIAGV